MTAQDTELSELESLLENRTRKTVEFDVPDILGQSGQSLGKVKMRIATVYEQDTAIREAHGYAELVAKNNGAAAIDSDLLENAKTAHILHKVCRNAKTDAPAFSSPKWMLEKMSVYELGILLNSYNEMVRAANPVDWRFDNQDLEAFAELCSKQSGTSIPNMYLAKYQSAQIAEIAIRMAILYHDTKQSNGS